MRAAKAIGMAAWVAGTALLGGCYHQTAPIYNPPPGGHDALSKPPPALLQSGS